ncbi:YcaO-like family protein [Vallitalea okinawensis]|uniref:YcaO-like family protein n=1 Tax=Vallitalea okinawensis TaxID=2078660 RepID=UPI000CFDE6AA|nr:YcaO-like family protein [Vallitalea okinawensis]
MVWQTNKYKDELPKDTIHKIRGILNQHGIVPMEKFWNNSAEDFYSVTLAIPKTTLKCNGKGTTYLYALASAYGELMERLQNFAPFRLGMDFDNKTNEVGGFKYAPDEKQIDVKDLVDDPDEWFKAQRHLLNGRIDTLTELWKGISYEEIDGDFIGIPFMNLMTNNISYIPIKMLNKMYMSNGMCAGNTREEALIQGICEVFERFVNKVIIANKITAPTIPRSYLYKYDRLANMIEEIESKGSYKVIVKDCSLGKGYPVIGVIFIDQKTHSYFVKFGSFPKFEIAVERTLTELLQGQDLHKMKGLTAINYKTTKGDHENLIGILVNGVGEYPKEFFEASEDYKWQPWSYFDAVDSHGLLLQVLGFIKDIGYEVYARDVSFLGFPSYHVIIPNFSEVEELTDVTSLKKYTRYIKIKKYLRHLHTLSDLDTRQLLNLLREEEMHPLNPVQGLLNLKLDEQSLPWYVNSIALLEVALYVKLEDYTGAYRALLTYVSSFDGGNRHKTPSYYQCLMQYLEMKIDNRPDGYIYETLKDFYDIVLIDHVILDFEPSNILNKHPKIFNCFNCEGCPVNRHCSYVDTREVYSELKETYGENEINQKEVFSGLRV